MPKKTYLATYWRNDGEWKTGGHDYNPKFIFKARNDKDATKLAIAYAQMNKKPSTSYYREEFYLGSLKEIKIKEVAVENESRFNLILITSELEEKVKEAEFEEFR